MVNKYTTGVPIIKPIDSIDVNFAHQVLVKKQEQYDSGYANLQKMFQSVEGLGLVNEYEKKYLQDKIKETTEKVNKLGNIDYSDNKVINALGNEVINIAKDETIQNAILNKQNYYELMEKTKKLKENPQLYEKYYSPYNEAEDNEKVLAYLEDKTLKHKFRTNTPTYKIDLNKKIDDELEKKMKIKRQRSDGVYIYTTEGLTEEELRAKVHQDIMTDATNRRQLEINAKWKYNNDKVFNNNYLSPLIKSYDDRIEALNNEIENNSAALVNAKGVGKEKEYELLLAQKQSLENKIKQFSKVRDDLNDTETELLEKKMYYELLQLEDRALLSFPQNVQMKENRFAILAQSNKYKSELMKEKFGYDVALENEKTKLDIEKAKTMDALGIDTGKSKNSDKTSSGINPIGEALPTEKMIEGSKESLLNQQIESFKSQNGEDFISLMSQIISEKIKTDSPDTIFKAVREAFVANKKKGLDGLGSKFFDDYIKKTPSYNKLQSIVKRNLIAQYNHLNSAYRDVLDGKQDVDYSSWEFKPETQEALTKIQIRSYNMKLKEEILAKARKQAEDKMITEVYGGNRQKFLQDKNAKEIITYEQGSSNAGLFSSNTSSQRVSSKDAFNNNYNRYIDSYLEEQTISLEKPYLLSEDSMNKENYATIKNIVSDAISNGGIYETITRTDDPIGLYGKRAGKPTNNQKFAKATDFNVTKVYSDSGIAEVEVIIGEGEKKEKARGYVKLKPESINEMYKKGLNQKSGDTDFNDVVEAYGSSPIMMSGTTPPLFYTVVRNHYTKKFDVKLMLTSDSNKIVHFNLDGVNPSAAKAKINQMIMNELNNSSNLAAMPPSEQKRQLIFDLLVQKYTEKVAK